MVGNKIHLARHLLEFKEQPEQCYNHYVPDSYKCAVRVWRFETSTTLSESEFPELSRVAKFMENSAFFRVVGTPINSCRRDSSVSNVYNMILNSCLY